jgi:hypothetical protein
VAVQGVAVIVTAAATAWEYLEPQATGGRVERHSGGHEMTDTQVRDQAVGWGAQQRDG